MIHDSAAIFSVLGYKSCSSTKGDLAKTQCKDIAGQLVRGIRVFDMRAKRIGGNKFRMVHGSVYVNAKFSKTLVLCDATEI